jgi:hypothetical protein
VPPARLGNRPVLTLRGPVTGLAALLLAACTGERQRPGPPVISLELPIGHVVASPDTFAVGVHAQDDNGLDSVVVIFLGEQREVFAFNEVEVSDFVFLTVPAGRIVGELVEVQAFARDLVGARTVTSATLTIVAPDTTSP